MEADQKNSQRIFFLVLILTVLIFTPGLSGPFQFDDHSSIVINPRVQIDNLGVDSLIQAATSSPASAIGRPIAALSFGINHAFAGLDPYSYKLTNLGLHLLNGLLIFAIIQSLLQLALSLRSIKIQAKLIPWVALLSTTLWLLHPLNLSPVLYIVQRMASLSALFVLLGFWLYILGRTRMSSGQSGRAYIIASLLLCTPLAVLSKENGVLLPGLLWVIEISLFRFSTDRHKDKRFLHWLYTVILIIPLSLAVLYSLWQPEWILRGYSVKEFGLVERLLSETRVLWAYVFLLFLPRLNQFSLYHDDVLPSTGLFTPWTTLPATLGLAIVVVFVISQYRKYPMATFSIGFFLMAHSLESSIFALELMQEHRNYIASLGPLLGISYFIFSFWEKVHVRKGLIAIIGIFLSLIVMTSSLRAWSWSSPIDQAIEEVKNHPFSARAQFDAGRVHAISVLIHQDNHPTPTAEQMNQREALFNEAKTHFQTTSELTEFSTLALASSVQLHATMKKPTPPGLIAQIKLQVANPKKTGIDQLMGMDTLLKAHHIYPESISLNEIERLYGAAIENPGRNNVSKARMLAQYAKFLINNRASPQRTVDAMIEAIKLDPKQLQHRMSLINILTSYHAWGQAKNEIDALRKKDRFGKMAVQISRVLLLIEAGLRDSANKPPAQ